MSGVFFTGTSALLAFQHAMATVSNNVANAATPGYSRQRVDLEARPGQVLANGMVGSGVAVARLQRLADSLVFSRQIDSSSELGRFQQLSMLSGRLDSLVSDSATSLSVPWSNFFGAAEGVVAEPTSPVARTQMLASGEQLASRWRSMDTQLATMDNDVDVRLQSQIGAVNEIAKEIADLNKTILAAGPNATPEMLDQRAIRIDKLASIVGAEAIEQDDGSMTVFTPGGQPLVLGQQAMTLTVTPDPFRPDRLQIGLNSPSGPIPLPSSSVAGELGGLLEFRERVLDPMRAELGLLAVSFAESFNATQRAGVDYNGNPGADMFSVPPPGVNAHTDNTGGAQLTTSIGDVGALTGTNLVLQFDSGTWTAKRADTGEAVMMTGTGTSVDPLVVNGMEIVVGTTLPDDGDRFMLRPTAGAASNINVVLKDPLGIAAAGPIQGTADAGNLGSVLPGGLKVTDADDFAGFAGAAIEFIDDTHYTIDGGAPIAYTPGTAITGPGWSMTLEGTPAAGDGFTLVPTPPRSSDNSNARALAGLDEQGVLSGGSVGLTAGISQLTGRIGNEARHAELSLEAQGAIHNQIVAERESVSGVNLDEEAADLMRFQQAYQAAAQVIATADDMFQTLIGVVRR